MKNKEMKKTADYQQFLLERLRKDEAFREAYLNEALEDEDQRLILTALRNVAQATGGLAKLSKTTGLNRQNLYRTLSKGGNPTWQRIEKIFDGLGYPLRAVGKKNQAFLRAAQEGSLDGEKGAALSLTETRAKYGSRTKGD